MKKKAVTVMLTVLLVFAAAGCSSNSVSGVSSPNGNTAANIEDTAQIANPWEDFDDLGDAEKFAGITAAFPDALDGFTLSNYRAMDGLIEAYYVDENSDELIVRKGTGDTEISGDYNEYVYTRNTVDDSDDQGGDVLNSCTDLIYKGDSRDSIKVVTWSLDGMQYAILVDTQNYDIAEADMSNYVTNIVEMNLEDNSDSSNTSAASSYNASWNAEETILQEILRNVEPGTAGTTLKAEGVAADALNWASETDLSEQEIQSIASDWKEKLGSDELSIYNGSFEAVIEVARKAVSGDKDTLTAMEDDAGIEVNTDSWTQDVLTLVEALE